MLAINKLLYVVCLPFSLSRVYLSLSLKSNCKSYKRAAAGSFFQGLSINYIAHGRVGPGRVLSRLEALTFCLVLIGLINVLQFRSVRNPVRPHRPRAAT